MGDNVKSLSLRLHSYIQVHLEISSLVARRNTSRKESSPILDAKSNDRKYEFRRRRTFRVLLHTLFRKPHRVSRIFCNVFFFPLMGSGVEPCRRQCRPWPVPRVTKWRNTAGRRILPQIIKKKAPVFASDALVSVVLFIYMLSAHS